KSRMPRGHPGLSQSSAALTSIRDVAEVPTLIFASYQVEPAVHPVETAGCSAKSARSSDDGMRYLKGDHIRVACRIKLPVENRLKPVTVGGGPVGMAGEGAGREIEEVN